MPSFLDSGFIVLLALLLFGPKKLPVLARQVGKLMADFRRASAEFRTQMEEELRISEQADRQKQIAAIEASAPPSPPIDTDPDNPHIPPPAPTFLSTPDATPETSQEPLVDSPTESAPTSEPLPIAVSGDLSILPPSTGLPLPHSAPASSTHQPAPESELETETLHG